MPKKVKLGTPEFKELEQKWYAKIKSIKGFEDFNDIEDTTREDRPLIEWHSRKFLKAALTRMPSTVEYYDQARDVLRTYKFKYKLHRQIWDLHCSGTSIRDIALVLKGVSKSTVFSILLKIQKDTIWKS